MRKELIENWQQTKEKLLDGLEGEKRAITGKLLENQRGAMLKENAAQVATTTSDIAGFRKAILPIVRRVIPGTIATDIVGVQPMDGPVGLVYTLRYRYGESMTANGLGAYDGSTYSVTKGDEAFGNNPPIRAYYSGGLQDAATTAGPGAEYGVSAGASGIDQTDPTAGPTAEIGNTHPSSGRAWGSSLNSTYANGVDGTNMGTPVGGSLFGGGGGYVEGSGGRTMNLQVMSQAVEAGTRRLQAGWTFESMQDLSSQHGMDMEAELAELLSAQITSDIDAEILNDLLQLAGTVRAYDHANTAGTTYSPAFVGDRFSNIASVINECANEIGRKTRIGQGNFIVVSPQIVSMLQTGSKSVFAPAIEGSFKGPTNNYLVGTLNGNIKVYSYLWNQASSLDATAANPFGLAQGTDKILVGYKGSGRGEAGYFYCPYVPLMSTGVVTNPVTYQQSQMIFTRYGKVSFTDPTISLGNSPDYYAKITLSNLRFY